MRSLIEIFTALETMKATNPFRTEPSYKLDGIGKTVLLYSGGLDSYAASFLLKPDICLCCNMQTQYSRKEIEFMVRPAHGKLVTLSDLKLTRFEMPESLIVPHRNALLVLMAAYYGSTIWLGAVANDLSTDKDQRFCNLMTELLKHVWQPSYWSPGVDVTVELPIRDMTKEQLIKRFIERGGNVDQLKRTVSCYHPTLLQCGECKACIKRWMGLAACGLDDSRWAKHPADMFVGELLERVKRYEYRGFAEDELILNALWHRQNNE